MDKTLEQLQIKMHSIEKVIANLEIEMKQNDKLMDILINDRNILQIKIDNQQQPPREEGRINGHQSEN